MKSDRKFHRGRGNRFLQGVILLNFVTYLLWVCCVLLDVPPRIVLFLLLYYGTSLPSVSLVYSINQIPNSSVQFHLTAQWLSVCLSEPRKANALRRCLGFHLKESCAEGNSRQTANVFVFPIHLQKMTLSPLYARQTYRCKTVVEGKGVNNLLSI